VPNSKLFILTRVLLIIIIASVIAGLFLPAGAEAAGSTSVNNQHLRSLRDALARHQDYTGRQLDNKVSVLSEVLTLIEQKYLREINFDSLVRVGINKISENQAGSGAEGDIAEAAINAMLASLDQHSNYMGPEKYKAMKAQSKGEFGGLGMEVTFEDGHLIVVSPIDNTPAAHAGIMAGDVISHIDGEEVAGKTLAQAVRKMRGPPGAAITLSILRQGRDELFDLSLIRAVIKVSAVRSQQMGDIAYIRISSFSQQAVPGVKSALAQITNGSGPVPKGLVLDLRNNPGGLFDQTIKIADMFLERGISTSYQGRKVSSRKSFKVKPGDLANGLPIIVLLNGGTSSASEVLAGALKDHGRAVLLGTRSFGKGTVQTISPLNGGGALRLTTVRFYRPSGMPVSEAGIQPDILFERADPDKDEELDMALMLLRQTTNDFVTMARQYGAELRQTKQVAQVQPVPEEKAVPNPEPEPIYKALAKQPENRHAVAVIIGNKVYADKVPTVSFAHNDADAMRDFLVNQLGYREGNIIDLRDASQARFTAVFGSEKSHKGKLFGYVRPNKSDVTVFYSGHGVPGSNDQRGYLLPVDGDPDLAEFNGYPIDLLFRNLAKIESRSMTVFLDACFSGNTPKGPLLRSASGISITPKMPEAAGKMVVVTAAQGDQLASWDVVARQGLFTKHLLRALKGAADGNEYGNGDGKVTLGEVQTYLDDEMTYQARRQFGRRQQVWSQGDPEVILTGDQSN
jgi:carboxyl-terminal processing protease